MTKGEFIRLVDGVFNYTKSAAFRLPKINWGGASKTVSPAAHKAVANTKAMTDLSKLTTLPTKTTFTPSNIPRLDLLNKAREAKQKILKDPSQLPRGKPIIPDTGPDRVGYSLYGLAPLPAAAMLGVYLGRDELRRATHNIDNPFRFNPLYTTSISRPVTNTDEYLWRALGLPRTVQTASPDLPDRIDNPHAIQLPPASRYIASGKHPAADVEVKGLYPHKNVGDVLRDYRIAESEFNDSREALKAHMRLYGGQIRDAERIRLEDDLRQKYNDLWLQYRRNMSPVMYDSQSR